MIKWNVSGVSIRNSPKAGILKGGLSTRIASRAPGCKGSGGRSRPTEALGYFGAKSCNLAISRHIIQAFGKSYFSKLFFKDFHQSSHQ